MHDVFFFCFVYFELKTLPQKAHFFFKNKAAGKFNTARLLKNPCNRVLRSSKRHPTITYRSFQKSTSKQPKKPIFCRDEQENQQKKHPVDQKPTRSHRSTITESLHPVVYFRAPCPSSLSMPSAATWSRDAQCPVFGFVEGRTNETNKSGRSEKPKRLRNCQE